MKKILWFVVLIGLFCLVVEASDWLFIEEFKKYEQEARENKRGLWK